MKKQILLNTQGGNSYYYSNNSSSFYFVHPQMKNVLDGKVDGLEPYYKAKVEFWEKNGVFDKYEPYFNTHIEPDKIKQSVANIRQVVIEVTDRCNLACHYCIYGEYYNNYDERTGKQQTFENVRALLDYLVEIWRSELNVSFKNTISIAFYGGEPLLNMALIEKTVEYIELAGLKSIEFSYNMTTNGLLLHKYMDFLAGKKVNLLVSLDGDRDSNIHRVTRNGENSFDRVFENVKLLQSRHPDYFERYVRFNAVMHKNSIEHDVRRFFKKYFNKEVDVSQLNTVGLNPEKLEHFQSMVFKQRETWFDKSKRKKIPANLKDLVSDRMVIQFGAFIDGYCGNTILSYLDLFEDRKRRKYIPTGTCFPFERKLFLTVNGKILPCERMGQNQFLSKVGKKDVVVDYESVSTIYRSKYEKVVRQCRTCALWKNCGQCVFSQKEEDGKIVCPVYISWHQANVFFSELLSFAETYRGIYEKVLNKLMLV